MSIKSVYIFIADFLSAVLFEESRDAKRIRGMSAESFRAAATPSFHPFALFDYKDFLVKSLIWNIKYRNHTLSIDLAAHILYEEIVEMSQGMALVILPVPSSSIRRRERGYSQTEKIVKGVEAIDSGMFCTICTDALVKTVHTERQTKLKRAERLENAHNSFSVTNAAYIEGKHILIIDDVITTGTTLEECSRVVREAGARSVRVLALAH